MLGVRLGVLTWLAVAAPAAAEPPAADVPVGIESLVTERGGERVLPDSCEGLPIARIDVVAHTIFDPVPPGRMAPAFRLANRLHVRTREQTIVEQLVVEPGEPWSGEHGRESVRRLRALAFLAPTQLTARRDGDSAIVTVETRDVWSTNPEFNIESADGRQFGSLAFTERNFLGLGKSISFAYRDLPSGRSRGVSYADPSLQGTRMQVAYDASSGGNGATDHVEVAQPFYAQDARRTFGFRWGRSTSVSSVYENAIEIANFNRRNDAWEAFWGAGLKRDGLVRRVVCSIESSSRRLGPTQALVPIVPPEYLGGEESLRLTRFSVEGRVWKPDFIERQRVNGFGLVEDFDLGQSAALRVGLSPRLLGSSQDEAYLRGRIDTGVLTPLGFGQLTATGSTRYQTFALESIGQLDARWVQQSRFRQTLVLAAHGIAGRNVERDFEAITGGLSGLRAYPVTAVAGRRLWRLNAENRWTLGERFWESVTVGAVTFADAARAWGPGSSGSHWFADAGVGLRLALPQWSLGQVMRIDVAWPINPTRDGLRKAVLSFGSSQAF